MIPMFSAAAVLKRIDRFADDRVKDLTMRLAYVGEDFIDNARTNGNYTDRTGNLRSSVGYGIILHGDIDKRRFNTGTAEGHARAQETIDQLAAENPTGLVLVGVAGMEYAAAVESKGYDVITGSVPAAEALLKELTE